MGSSLAHAAVALLVAAAIVLASAGVGLAIILGALAHARAIVDDAKSILRRAEHARDRSYAREQLALDVLRDLVPVRPEIRAEPEQARRDEHR